VEKPHVLHILSVCVCDVALGILHAMHMRYIVIFGLSAHSIFPHLVNGAIFEKENDKT
jgi:hypothetical protein